MLLVLPAVAHEHNPVLREPTAAQANNMRVIVKLRVELPDGAVSKTSIAEHTAQLGKRTGLAFSDERQLSDSLIAARLAHGVLTPELALERLRGDPAVESVSLDARRFPHAVPNDSLFTNQWYLQAAEVSAVNAVGAWDREVGSNGVVVAVLDTGVLFGHPDLARTSAGGKLLPGHDFVGAPRSNDGDDWDADPADPGDWIDSDDREDAEFEDCDTTSSSWHGTRVAGMIGALTGNASGIAGLSWNSLILPVRVLGKCGGIDSEIIAGMRWAAGLHVAGVPDNPNPARVINLSLGGSNTCSAAYQSVINELATRKVLVVVSAGNESTVVSSPGNCDGIASVLALRHAGSKVGFSSLGPEVTIGAPGGNCVNVNGGPCLFSLDTTSNSGSTSPQTHIFTDQLNSNLGTSFSAPIVSGIAALMISRNANLSTAQLLARLREGAVPYPTTVAGTPNLPVCHVPTGPSDIQPSECLCTTAACGAGMANAANSVAAADRPIAAILRPQTVAAGQNVSLNAGGSAAACGRSIATFAWTVVLPVSNPPVLVAADTAEVTVIAPVSGSYTLRLTVTDDLGRTDSADVVVSPSQAISVAPASAGGAACATPIDAGPAPLPTPTPTPLPSPPTPTPAAGGGGGGGALDWLSAIGLLMSLLWSLRSPARFSRCI